MRTTPDPADVRDALRRNDPDVLTPGADQRFLITRVGAVAIDDTAGSATLALEHFDPREGRDIPLVHLGVREGLRITAVELPENNPDLDAPGRDMRDLRRIADRLAADDAALAMTAVAMGAWHRDTRFCPRCGHPLAPEHAGWVLRCTADGSQHFPRTDPAVIMSLTDEENRLLLARGARSPERFWSVLAGFVEPGETPAEAVARECYEEVGLAVTEVRWVDAQPWPFPRSLMLGHTARVRGSAPALRHLDGELAEATWVTREELRDAVESGRMRLPGPLSLGHRLIRDWYGQVLPTTGAARRA